jgi:hypothetical protein
MNPSFRSVGTMQRQVRADGIKIEGSSGTPSLSEGQFRFDIADQGVGDYLITPKEAYLRAPVVIPSSRTAGTHIRCVPAAGSIQVLCFTDETEATPEDADLDLLIWGFDSRDEV